MKQGGEEMKKITPREVSLEVHYGEMLKRIDLFTITDIQKSKDALEGERKEFLDIIQKMIDREGERRRQ